jgi:hypothetical protein
VDLTTGPPINRVAEEDDPIQRMLTVVRWYISGWHVQPKNCKKPYNPVLGEQFIAFWDHGIHYSPITAADCGINEKIDCPTGDSRTDYYSEQVSHHPPVSAFYMTNRKKNIVINGSFRCISTMSGNKASSQFVGDVHVSLLNRLADDGSHEDYVINFPSFIINGLMVGHMYMQLIGKCTIKCAATGLHAFIQFMPKVSSLQYLSSELIFDGHCDYTMK